MPVSIFMALPAVAWLCAMACGCGDSIPLKTSGEPCTRADDCRAPLTCKAGICVAPVDAGADAGERTPLDAGKGPEAGIDDAG